MDWDEYFINIAEQVKLKSKDVKTQIGVVLAGRNYLIVSTGYNSFQIKEVGVTVIYYNKYL